MHTKLALSVLLVAACGGSNETSPAGPIGKPIDLRSRITKPDVASRAPTDDKATKHEHALDVHGVKAQVVWRTFEDSGARYILSAGWEIVTPSKGITLESLGVMNPVNAGTVATPVQSEMGAALSGHARQEQIRSLDELQVRPQWRQRVRHGPLGVA